ncbi:hypothetical protein CC2G_004065 [Coprinopsis cinerea AmutBmut pab1-1]|nr:hypothetical protein CC2G_004065 [Coprinopsis cinerea AmutBmut pab1-1]
MSTITLRVCSKYPRADKSPDPSLVALPAQRDNSAAQCEVPAQKPLFKDTSTESSTKAGLVLPKNHSDPKKEKSINVVPQKQAFRPGLARNNLVPPERNLG